VRRPILTFPAEISAAQAQELRARWEEAHRRARRGGLVVLPPGLAIEWIEDDALEREALAAALAEALAHPDPDYGESLARCLQSARAATRPPRPAPSERPMPADYEWR